MYHHCRDKLWEKDDKLLFLVGLCNTKGYIKHGKIHSFSTSILSAKFVSRTLPERLGAPELQGRCPGVLLAWGAVSRESLSRSSVGWSNFLISSLFWSSLSPKSTSHFTNERHKPLLWQCLTVKCENPQSTKTKGRFWAASPLLKKGPLKPHLKSKCLGLLHPGDTSLGKVLRLISVSISGSEFKREMIVLGAWINMFIWIGKWSQTFSWQKTRVIWLIGVTAKMFFAN